MKNIFLCYIITNSIIFLFFVFDIPTFLFLQYKSWDDPSIVYDYYYDNNKEEYGIIIDAGSSGSRIHIFKWKKNDVLNTITEISRKKITPGISHYITYDEPGISAGNSLNGLLKYAEEFIPKALYKSTRLSLKATAGMRLLKRSDQLKILLGVTTRLTKSKFQFQVGNAKVVSGINEALFAWTTVNIAKNIINNISVIKKPEYKNMEKSYGIIELGGGSSHIVQPSFQIYEERSGLKHLKILYGEQRLPFCLFAISRLHFGLHRAYELLIEFFMKTAYIKENGNGDTFPCAFEGDPKLLEDFDHDKRIHAKSNYNRCKKLVKKLLRKLEEEDIAKIGDGIRPTLFELQKDNPVSYYALDNFAKLITIMAKDGLNLPNKWDETANEIKITDVKEIITNSKQLCNNFDYATYMKLLGHPKKTKLKRKACFGVVYMELLMKHIYNVVPSKKHPTIFAHQIDNKVDAGWTLGAMINDIYVYNEKLNHPSNFKKEL